MGFFGIESSSSAVDRHQQSGDNGKNIQGSNTVYAEAGALAQGAKSKYQAAGAIDIGSKAHVNTGLQISKLKNSGKGNLNVTINDPSATLALTDKFASALQSVSSSGAATLQDSLSTSSKTIGDALGKLSDLGQTTQTGGATETNKTVLYIVLGVLAAIVAVFYFRSK